MNLPQEIKDLYKQHSIPKRFRLHFPNGERPDILNENIEEESMVIHQRLCSKERLQFGMCEASSIECSVFDIENRWITDEEGNRVENPVPLRGNIKGCEIDVIQEIDISSCSPEFIDQYGKTADDVPWPFYEVSFGRYKIESCQKTANMDTRKIEAYDALNSSTLDKSLLPWAASYYGQENYSTDIDEIMTSIISFAGMKPADSISEEVDIGEQGIIEGVFNVPGTVPKEAPGRYVANTAISDCLDKKYSVFDDWYGSLERVNIPAGKYLCQFTYDMEQVELFREHLNRLGGTFENADEVLALVDSTIYLGSVTQVATQSIEGSAPYYYVVVYNKATAPNVVFDFSGNCRLFMKMTMAITRDDSDILIGSGGYGNALTTLAKYPLVKNIKLLPYGGYGDKGGGGITIDFGYDKETGTCKVPEDEFTVRNILGGILEINGLFGTMTREGVKVRQLDNAYWELKENWLLESEWLLNDSPDTTVADGTQEEAWYDEDCDTGLYGTVRILGHANQVLAKYTGSSGGMTYNIEDNPLFLYMDFTSEQMKEICQNLQNKICSIKWTPASIDIMARPYLEIGDRVAFDDNGRKVCTYIFDKVTSGIVSMKDEIDSTMVRE